MVIEVGGQVATTQFCVQVTVCKTSTALPTVRLLFMWSAEVQKKCNFYENRIMPRTRPEEVRPEEVSNTAQLSRCRGPGRRGLSPKGCPPISLLNLFPNLESYLLRGTADRREAVLSGTVPSIPSENLQTL